jgi:preprotein translocase subunit YajC
MFLPQKRASSRNSAGDALRHGESVIVIGLVGEVGYGTDEQLDKDEAAN